MNVTVRQTCRLCGSRSLTPVVDLGPQTLASAFVTKETAARVPTRKVPLELVRCNDVANAAHLARERAGPDDRILVFGSFYTVAAALRALDQGVAQQ